MPIGYLISLVVPAIPLIVLLLPDRWPREPRRRTFVVTMTFSELPAVVLALLALSTVLAVNDDNLLANPVGWIGFIAALLIAAGYVELIRRAVTARSVVSAALAESVYGAPEPRSAWSRLIRLVLPFPIRPRDVVRAGDISYGPDPRHRLDVYRKRGRSGPGPVLIFMHAGGYSSGSRRREGKALLHRLAQRGWTCISADYRLRPQVGWPEHLIDARRAIAWVRTAGPAHDIEATTVVFAGSSAGGHLAMLGALLPQRDDLQPGFEGVDTRIDATVCMYGYHGRYFGRAPGDDPPSSPFEVDASDAPPILIGHGDRDGWVHVELARRLTEHLRATSRNPVVYAELPSAEHGFDRFVSARAVGVADGVAHFAESVVAANQPSAD